MGNSMQNGLLNLKMNIQADFCFKMETMMEATYPMQHIISCADYPHYFDCNSNSAIPTLVQIPLESSSLQVIAIKPNKNLPKEAIVALSPDYFHQLWLPAADQ